MLTAKYFFSIQIMPLNFPEFWPLVKSITNYKLMQQGYEKTKVKLSYNKFHEILPAYYNDYLN